MEYKQQQQQQQQKKKKKKKIQIGIHIVLTNYKYTKLLFLNILKCNHLLTKTKKGVFFLVFFFFCFLVEVKEFTIMGLKEFSF